MDINEAADNGAAEQRVAEPSGVARRRLIVGGATGAALSLVPFLIGRASAGAKTSGLPTAGSSDGTFTDNSNDSFENSPSVNSTDDGSTTGTGDATVGTDPGGAGNGSGGGGGGSPAGTQPGYSGTGDSTNSPTGNSTDDSTGGSIDPTGDTTGGSTGDSTGDTEPATTTTAPPKRPTGDDEMLLSFAQSLELTAYDLYQQAVSLNTFTGATLEVVRAITEAHQAYGQAISGLLGRDAPNANIAPLFNELKAGFAGDQQAVATAAQELENTLVATHIDLVGRLLGVDGSALIASVLVVEARHATVMARLAGVLDLEDQLTSEGEALSADDYAAANA